MEICIDLKRFKWAKYQSLFVSSTDRLLQILMTL